jgi:hypothetical protein
MKNRRDLPGWFLAEQQNNFDSSTTTFYTSLIFNVSIGVILYLVFSFVRPWNITFYSPRMLAKHIRSPKKISSHLFSWIITTTSISDRELLKDAGLDAYMFLRFLRLSRRLFLIFTIIGLPIMLPLNIIRSHKERIDNRLDGIREWTVANITDEDRFWGHVVCSYLFLGKYLMSNLFVINNMVRDYYLLHDKGIKCLYTS